MSPNGDKAAPGGDRSGLTLRSVLEETGLWGKGPCWICSIAQREEIDEGLRTHEASRQGAVEYLVRLGYFKDRLPDDQARRDFLDNKLHSHLNRKHHERGRHAEGEG